MCDQIDLNNRPKVQDLYCNHCGFNFREQSEHGIGIYNYFHIEIGFGPKEVVTCKKCNQIVNEEVRNVIVKWFYEISERQNMLIRKKLI